MKKRCNAFIPDFFGVHDMYLLVIGSYDHSRWFVCIFGREIQTSCYKCCLLRAVLVWTQMKLQQKQEVISDFPKKSKKYFNTRGENQSHLAFEILPKSGEGRPTKKSSKKDTWVIVMSLICLSYLDIFDYTSYYTPYLDPKLHHYQEPHQFRMKLFTNSPGRDFVLLLYKSTSWVSSKY